MDEPLLIEGCKKADRVAQKQLFDRYAEAMLLVCMRYVKHQPDAEEMMLNGFYKFFATIDRFVYGGPGNIAAWLKKIMVNECLMFLRKRGGFELVSEEQATAVATDSDIIASMHAAALYRYVLALPDGYRAVFNMYAVEGMTHKEIAAALGISEGTSKSQLAKARMLLQKNIQKEIGCYEK